MFIIQRAIRHNISPESIKIDEQMSVSRSHEKAERTSHVIVGISFPVDEQKWLDTFQVSKENNDYIQRLDYATEKH